MAVHRPERRRNPVRRVVTLAAIDTGTGDRDLKAAAEIIRQGARALAAGWSREVPESISIRMEGTTAIIAAGAPPARPAELRLPHPLFGNREHWYGPPGAPFLGPAVDALIDPALRRYAQKVDGWARKDGFR